MSTPREVLHALEALSTTRNVRAERSSDHPDRRELATTIYELGLMLRQKYGMYEQYNALHDAAAELEVCDSELEEARQTVHRLIGQVRDLMEMLAIYRTVQVVPATRETPAEYGVERVEDPDEEHG